MEPISWRTPVRRPQRPLEFKRAPSVELVAHDRAEALSGPHGYSSRQLLPSIMTPSNPEVCSGDIDLSVRQRTE